MIVHFGLHLDGMQPAPPVTAIGVAMLGPARLLDLLELRLGLPQAVAKSGEALLAYRACLAEIDNPSRFYHRSFETDAIGVARTLLDWRAAWHEAGWSGAFARPVSRRLADMAEVEAIARRRVPLDAGQRLERISAALDDGIKTGIERIIMHDDPDALPAAWRRVFDHLDLEVAAGVRAGTEAAIGGGPPAKLRVSAPASTPPSTASTAPVTSVASASRARPGERGTAADGHGDPRQARTGETLDLFGEATDRRPHTSRPPKASRPQSQSRQQPQASRPQPPASTRTDLERIQAVLGAWTGDGEGVERGRERLAGDDSVIVVRGISRDLTAQAIGERLLKAQTGQADPSLFDRTVVIAERDGIIVDNAFERVGLPRAGFQHYSRFRAVAQVLKLCLGLVWEPVSPHLLLQFLIHPVGPLPDHVRSRLAEAVAAEPGVGGTAWRQTLDEIAERMRTKFERTEKETQALIHEIRYWLECERFAPAGAPLGVLIERAQRLTKWLARKLHGSKDPHEIVLFAAAEAQSEALIAALAALRDQGDSRIARIALERLVDEVGGRAADPATFAEARHVRATTEPAAVTGEWQTVIWWDLAAQPSMPRYPWSDAELAELAAEGVELRPVEDRIRDRIEEWLRPILNAREQLILVVHDRDEGSHPLWSRLESLFENFNEVRIEDALLHGEPAPADPIPALGIPTAPLALAPLPRPRRWWTLPPDVTVPPRATESYSSLAKLIDHPHEWVLHYGARLRTGRAADLPSGGLLYGRLAHRLFERFFKTHGDWATLDARAIEVWLADYLPVLVAQEGALLCEAGSGVRREQITAILERAFAALLAHLKSANVVSAAAEQSLEAPFADVTLKGAIDLQLTDAHGREIVLDVKWSGESFRGGELEQGRCLQLATYAFMSRTARSLRTWPHHAYFIVTTGNVVAPDAAVFPDAVVFAPRDGGTIADIWARMSRTYAWRRAQIAAGRIEVTAEGTEPTTESVPPADGVATEESEDRFDDFTWLTGWDEGA